ncbi:MAG: hypothetical protein NVS1B4_06440 [Gemmatimonadaceae bacterium]
MTSTHRPRRRTLTALTAISALAFTACATYYPNSTFTPHSEFGRAIDALWDTLLFWGTLVFVFVEGLLVWTLIRYRARAGAPAPKHVHGNTTLEILWTVIPALILVVIAIPTVRTIFRTQAKAAPTALQVEVIGHQWWWEFRYPQLGITTANELYLPHGRTVNFALKTADVLHSFWIPQLGGKRDLISNHTNHLWFTPDSAQDMSAWNGFCAEYCGSSHANMHFRVFTVSPADFASWAEHQKLPAVYTGPVLVAPTGDSTKRTPARRSRSGAAKPEIAHNASQSPPSPAPGFIAFPTERIPDYARPSTPVPDGINFPAGLTGDPARGLKVYSSGQCIACHIIAGNPMSVGIVGPNLTHVGSRRTIAGGLYLMDTAHLVRWIKNAPVMKPGSKMPTLGKAQLDPQTGRPAPTGVYSDQDIADIAAYLQALK